MKRTGEIITFNTIVSPALNVYGQVGVPTGITPGGNEGLLLIGGQFEFNVFLDQTAQRDIVLARGSKTSMPSITDDDVFYKRTDRFSFTTSGAVFQDMTPELTIPPISVVLVESQFYLQYKTTGQITAQSCAFLGFFEKVVLTTEEKNTILASRLNNLLS